jgi:hypothetical protein
MAYSTEAERIRGAVILLSSDFPCHVKPINHASRHGPTRVDYYFSFHQIRYQTTRVRYMTTRDSCEFFFSLCRATIGSRISAPVPETSRNSLKLLWDDPNWNGPPTCVISITNKLRTCKYICGGKQRAAVCFLLLVRSICCPTSS